MQGGASDGLPAAVLEPAHIILAYRCHRRIASMAISGRERYRRSRPALGVDVRAEYFRRLYEYSVDDESAAGSDNQSVAYAVHGLPSERRADLLCLDGRNTAAGCCSDGG